MQCNIIYDTFLSLLIEPCAEIVNRLTLYLQMQQLGEWPDFFSVKGCQVLHTDYIKKFNT